LTRDKFEKKQMKAKEPAKKDKGSISILTLHFHGSLTIGINYTDKPHPYMKIEVILLMSTLIHKKDSMGLT